MSSRCETPVLLVAYRRRATTQQVLARIRMAGCTRLFVAVNAPDPTRPDDRERVEEVRALVQNIDPLCEGTHLFREKHLSARDSIAGAISWFFSQVEEGIILEDDCLPDASFFPFCQAALERYRSEARVGMISGNNHGNFQTDRGCSCHLSSHGGIWGWATWRDRWEDFDDSMDRYSGRLDQLINESSRRRRYRIAWGRLVRAAYCGELDTWDASWAVALRATGRATLRPRVNLVANIGEMTGTNCSECVMPEVYKSSQSLEPPFRFPGGIAVDRHADRLYEREWARIMTEPVSIVATLRSWRWRLAAMGRQLWRLPSRR